MSDPNIEELFTYKNVDITKELFKCAMIKDKKEANKQLLNLLQAKNLKVDETDWSNLFSIILGITAGYKKGRNDEWAANKAKRGKKKD